MSGPVAIVMFGRFAITQGGRDVTGIVAPSLRRVLGHLLLNERSPERRALAAELWPDEMEREAGANLRRRLHELVRAFARLGVGEALIRTPTTIALAPSICAASDVFAYRRAVEEGRFREAASLYAEPLFPGLDDDWLVRARDRMHVRHVELIGTMLEDAIRRGDGPAIYDCARMLLDLDPLSEEMQRRAVTTLWALGERDRARRLFDAVAKSMRDEIGIEPENFLQESAAVMLPSGATPFIEREHEVASVCNALVGAPLVTSARRRLVTLVGPPGVGKSRVALHAAGRVADRFVDSVRYLDASSYPGAQSFVSALADLLQAGEATIEAIGNALRARSMLLVLDNLDAFAAELAPLLEMLLSRMQGGAVLASARAPLRLAGECIVAIPPFELARSSLASTAALERVPAVAFFLDRAELAGARIERTQERLTSVAEICRELDGIPLALELAAMRVRALGLANLRALLRDRFRLLDALRSAYAWSYERLTETDRHLFRALGVFHAPWSLADASALTSIPVERVAEGVARLADASLIVPDLDAEFYSTLRSTREFMRLSLAESGELDDAELHHLALVLQPIVARNAELRGAHAEQAFEALERRMDDVRAALEAAIVRERDLTLGVRALAALSRFFFEREHTLEARRWYDEALTRLAEPSALRAEARYLHALLGRAPGGASFNLADFEGAIEELRAFGDPETLAKALLYAANAARMIGRGDYARRLALEANAIVTARGDAYLVGFSHAALGAAAYALGDLELAEREFTTARRAYRDIEASNDEALMLVDAARCALGRGDAASAEPVFQEALSLALSSGNRYVEAHARLSCALAALDRGDPVAARPHIARAAEIALGGSDVELSLIALEAAAELWVTEESYERAASAMASADGVRNAGSICRAPAERARCDRTRHAAGARAVAAPAAVRTPETTMRALLAAVGNQEFKTTERRR